MRPVGGGPVKIGRAGDPEQRLVAMQRDSPVPLELLATIRGRPILELQLHYRFREAALHSEWFRPVPELLEFIEAIE